MSVWNRDLGRDNYYARNSRLIRLLKNVEPIFNAGRGLYRTGRALAGSKRKVSGKIVPAPPRKKLVAKVAFSNGSGQTNNMKMKSKGRKRKPLTLKRRIKNLEKKTRKMCFAKHTLLKEATFQVNSAANKCGYAEGNLVAQADFEALITKFPYIDETAPTANSKYDARGIPHPAKWCFKVASKCIMRNNYLYPVDVRCYILKPKHDSDLPAYNALYNGIVSMSNGDVYDVLAPEIYPSTSIEFGQQYKILKSCKMRLQSGDECVVPFNEDIVYDHKENDVNTLAYSPKNTRVIFIRVQGVVTHDSTTSTNVGFAPTQIDCVIQRKISIVHPADAPIRTLQCDSGLSAITTAVVGVSSAEREVSLS